MSRPGLIQLPFLGLSICHKYPWAKTELRPPLHTCSGTWASISFLTPRGRKFKLVCNCPTLLYIHQKAVLRLNQAMPTGSEYSAGHVIFNKTNGCDLW